MLKDITLGQYYPADSAVHKLDPRVKLVATVVFIISLFVFRSISSYLTATLFLAGVIRLSKVPFRYMVKGLKTIFILMLITVAFNLFLTDGTPVLQIWKLTITLEGIRTAAFMAIRLVYLIIGSSVMTLTTTPNDLTDGMEKGLRFLKKIHVPVHEIAMIMSIALRFIPILMEEADKIMKAQMARGADFESGNLIERAKSLVPISFAGLKIWCPCWCLCLSPPSGGPMTWLWPWRPGDTTGKRGGPRCVPWNISEETGLPI